MITVTETKKFVSPVHGNVESGDVFPCQEGLAKRRTRKKAAPKTSAE